MGIVRALLLGLLATLALLALLLPVACGDGDGGPLVRVAIETLPADGVPPEPLWLVPVEADAAATRIRLERRGAGPEGLPLYVAHAPAASYQVVNDQGWSMLTTGQTLPWFHAAPTGPPNVVALARPYTLYLRARSADRWKAAPRVAIEQRIDGDPHTWQRLDLAVVDQGGGWVSLRLPTDIAVPRAQFRVFAFMEGDVPARMTTLTIPAEPAMPYIRLLETDVGAPLVVRVVGGEVSDGTRLEARLVDHPLDPRWEGRVVAGRAWFAHLGDHVQGVQVHLPSWGEQAHWHLDAAAWETEGTLVLLALPPIEAQRRVRVPLAAGTTVRRLLLRAADAAEQGLVPFQAGEEGIVAIVPPGVLTGWIETSAGLASLDIAADAAEAVVGPLGKAATVGGNVTVGAPGFRVLAERQEGDAWIGGAGLDVVVQPGGRYALEVPPGRYRLSVQRPDLRAGEPTPIPVALNAGTRFSGFDLVGR